MFKKKKWDFFFFRFKCCASCVRLFRAGICCH